MRSVAVVAMVGALAFALSGAAAARGPGGGGGGGPQMGGFHGGGGMHAPMGGGMHAAMPSRGFGGGHVSNLRSNSGGLRRGSTRASYVHGLNNQRTHMAAPRPPIRGAALPPPRPPLAGGAPPRPPIPGGPTAAAGPRPPLAGGPGRAPPPPVPGPSGSAIPPGGITGSSQTPNR
jgi:hypothetical protein